MSSPVPPPKPPKSPKPPPPRPPPPAGRPPPPATKRPETPPPPASDDEESPPPSDDDESPPPSPPPSPPSSRSPISSSVSNSSKIFVGSASHIPSTARGGLSPVRYASSAENAAAVRGKPYKPSPHDSIRSNTSSISISSFSGKFRPESSWSQATGSTSVDQEDEVYAAGYYAMYDNALMQNILSKMNRSGNFEKVVFVLTPEELIYIKLPTIKPNSKAATALATITGSNDSPNISKKDTPEPSRSLPLSTLLAMPLGDGEQPGKKEKRNRVFKILAKQKSFFVRAATVELKDQWMRAIQEASSELQLRENGEVRDVAQTAPIYVHTENNCQICNKIFTFFIRKNHCHNCGKCICEMCSRDKMRVLKIDDKKLFRVCNPCGKEIKSQRVYGVARAGNDEDDA